MTDQRQIPPSPASEFIDELVTDVKSLGYVFPGSGPLSRRAEIMSHIDCRSSDEILFKAKQL